MELTKEELLRQDFVDNEIQLLIEKLNPTSKKIDWDIETIAKIRDVVAELFVSDLNICDDFSFYPFIKES